MATESEHIKFANESLASLKVLHDDPADHSAWVTTIAFYRSLHIVEAMFANDPGVVGTHTHGERDQILKTTSKYRFIYENYSKLYRASQNARYLQAGSFHEFMSEADVESYVLRKFCVNLEHSF